MRTTLDDDEARAEHGFACAARLVEIGQNAIGVAVHDERRHIDSGNVSAKSSCQAETHARLAVGGLLGGNISARLNRLVC